MLLLQLNLELLLIADTATVLLVKLLSRFYYVAVLVIYHYLLAHHQLLTALIRKELPRVHLTALL